MNGTPLNSTPNRAFTSNAVSSPPQNGERPSSLADHEGKVLEAIRNTAFGTIEIVIHQSKIVQLTRSEKVRFEQG